MIELSYVSLFSGIEAFSVAAIRVEGVRWNPVFFSEIDQFPCAVLAHHFPDVPNLGDINKIKIENGVATNGTTRIILPRGGIDILAGGSPCQDVSIAGQRRGMQEGSGTRSSLAFEYARLVEELHPRVILWENVPGVLSSNGGLDFAAFLDTLGKLGYRSLAYRVLDAQYTRVDGFPRGVPQRRKRVWLVGCAGADESVPAQILFERPGLLGDTPPRREAGKGFACPIGYCATGDDRVVGGAGCRAFVPYGTRLGASPEGIIQPLTHIDSKFPQCVALRTDTIGGGGHDDVSEILTARSFKGIGARNGQISGPFVAVATFENHGQDSRVKEIEVSDTRSQKDGTGGNNLPLVVTPQVCKTLTAEGFDGMPDVQKGNGQQIVAIRTANTHANGHGVADESTHTIDCANGQAVAIGFKAGQSANGGLGDEVEVCPTQSHEPSALEPTVAMRHIVRRLTPGECESLQGFPQGWTRIPWRGKPADQCPDSPRYKALGNSWATNCAEWILRRIVAAIRLGMV